MFTYRYNKLCGSCKLLLRAISVFVASSCLLAQEKGEGEDLLTVPLPGQPTGGGRLTCSSGLKSEARLYGGPWAMFNRQWASEPAFDAQLNA